MGEAGKANVNPIMSDGVDGGGWQGKCRSHHVTRGLVGEAGKANADPTMSEGVDGGGWQGKCQPHHALRLCRFLMEDP